jgi:IclR family acetate operon transcriptional repressor
MAKRDNPSFLKVVGKAFEVLEATAQAKDGSRISDLARTLGQPKATVYRIFYTLQELGYVEKDATDVYRLTARIKGGFTHDVGREVLSRVARPHMERLLVQFEQTVNLAVLDDHRVFYLEILEGLRSIRMAATTHTYEALHTPALGKAMLAFFEPGQAEELLSQTSFTMLTPKTVPSLPSLMKQLVKFRKQGYALDDEEVELGARCVAAPIFNAQGKPWAAISISGPVSHIRMQDVEKIGQAVTDACQKISAQGGFKRIHE